MKKQTGPRFNLPPESAETIWVVRKKKEKKEDEALVVPKVVKQYTRKRKDKAIENNHIGVYSAGTSSLVSDQTCSDTTVENHVRIKEETECDSDSPNTTRHFNKVDCSVKVEPEAETDPAVGIQCDEGNPIKKQNTVHIITEDISEYSHIHSGVNHTNSAQQKYIKLKKINASQIPHKIINRNSSSIEVQQNPKRMENKLGIKMEPVELDLEVEGHSIEDLDLEVKKEPIEQVINREQNTEEDLQTSNSLNKQAKKALLRKTANAFEKGEENTDSELIPLKKCYLMAVNVATNTSNLKGLKKWRKVVHNRPVALLAADNVRAPDNLGPFKVVAKSEIFTCEMCDQHFLSNQEIKEHLDSAHRLAMRYHCDKCHAKFPHYHQFITHIRRHAGKPYVCDLCEKRFKCASNLSVHLNSHLREHLYTCPVCLRRYANLENLRRHTACHGSEKEFECESCTEEKIKYGSLPELRYHKEKIHNEKPPYPCYVCTRVLNSKTEFYDHLKAHDNAVYECGFCPKRFTDATRWEEHSTAHIMKIKTNKTFVSAPFACEICHRRYMYKSTLKTHMRVHTGERPYTCSICSKHYKTVSSLSEHEKGHNRPYECTICGVGFGKRDTLDRHYRIHSGERPYSCPTCGSTFTQRSSLTHHYKRLHCPRVLKKRGRKPRSKSALKKKKP